MEKGQKFIMKIDKYYGKDNLLKQGDVIEFVGNKRSFITVANMRSKFYL